MDNKKILIIEDDTDMGFIMSVQLKEAGYSTDIAASCEEALTYLKQQKIPDLILLDEMLTDGKGSELCTVIRRFTLNPIIFISCMSDPQTMVEALKNGGDDYVVKPVNMEVLLARIESQLRRSIQYKDIQVEKISENSILYFRQFAVEKSTHFVWRVDGNGKRRERIHLSPIEYKLLISFIEHANELMTYEELYQYIWEADDLGDVRTVMVHVSNLRKKINYKNTDMIHTVRGAGYLFNDV